MGCCTSRADTIFDDDPPVGNTYLGTPATLAALREQALKREERLYTPPPRFRSGSEMSRISLAPFSNLEFTQSLNTRPLSTMELQILLKRLDVAISNNVENVVKLDFICFGGTAVVFGLHERRETSAVDFVGKPEMSRLMVTLAEEIPLSDMKVNGRWFDNRASQQISDIFLDQLMDAARIQHEMNTPHIFDGTNFRLLSAPWNFVFILKALRICLLDDYSLSQASHHLNDAISILEASRNSPSKFNLISKGMVFQMAEAWTPYYFAQCKNRLDKVLNLIAQKYVADFGRSPFLEIGVGWGGPVGNIEEIQPDNETNSDPVASTSRHKTTLVDIRGSEDDSLSKVTTVESKEIEGDVFMNALRKL